MDIARESVIAKNIKGGWGNYLWVGLMTLGWDGEKGEGWGRRMGRGMGGGAGGDDGGWGGGKVEVGERGVGWKETALARRSSKLND